MHRVALVALVALVLGLSPVAFADDPFSCVASDVADAFVGDTYQERGEISTTIPDGFVKLSLPRGMSLVGSQTTQRGTRVVFKTEKGADNAVRSFIDSMAPAGWSENEGMRSSRRGGFQVPGPIFSNAVICKAEDDNAIWLSSIERLGQTFVYVGQVPAARSCGNERAETSGHDPMKLMDRLPILRLPEGVEAIETGSGGSGHEASSRTDVSGAGSRAAISDYLEAQIREQGWEFQASWSSIYSSGSVWARESADEGLLVGTLHIMDSGSDPMRVRFSVTPADPAMARRGNGSWSGVSM